MQTLKKQTDAKIEMGRKANPNFMKGVDEIISEARALKKDANAIEVSQKIPNFELPNQEGNLISISDLLEKGPIVLTFYRGSWCPYCNLQLKALQSKLSDIHNLGAQLIAISPEVPDESLSKNEIEEMDFEILSDQDAKVALEYGVAWEIPEFLSVHMKNDRGLDLEIINNGNGSILPIPATFVINKEGIATWRYVDIDYRTRCEPDDIIDALQRLA